MTREASIDDVGQLIEARRSEAMVLFTTAKTYAVRNDALVGVGAALIAAVTGLGVKEDVEEVLLGAPAALLLLIVYSLHVETDVRLMTIAQRKLEEVLEDLLGEPALIYQSCADSRRGLHSVVLLQAVGLLLTFSLVVAGAVVAADAGGFVLAVYSVVTALLIGIGILARYDMTRSEKRACEWVSGWTPRTRAEWRSEDASPTLPRAGR